MRKLMVPLLAIATGMAALSSLQAQTPYRANSDRVRPSHQRGSSFYTKGPNAAFKNQQRKFTDPLNANGR